MKKRGGGSIPLILAPARACSERKHGRARYKKSPLRGLPRRGRESSGDLLSRARGPGTIGDEGLDFRVRKGNGYDPLSVTAETKSLATMSKKPFAQP